VVPKFLVSATLAAGAAMALGSAPAGADPSVFNELSCSCSQTTFSGGSSVTDQIDRGILSGLADDAPDVEVPQ
jgi:hypothetical protein